MPAGGDDLLAAEQGEQASPEQQAADHTNLNPTRQFDKGRAKLRHSIGQQSYSSYDNIATRMDVDAPPQGQQALDPH